MPAPLYGADDARRCSGNSEPPRFSWRVFYL
ncbi:DUF2856 family protein [Escherichia coli]|nr:DUF2856 family protein [Escherichia coli]NDZ05565.1 DUF2856 family protein [Escherichia coli]